MDNEATQLLGQESAPKMNQPQSKQNALNKKDSSALRTAAAAGGGFVAGAAVGVGASAVAMTPNDAAQEIIEDVTHIETPEPEEVILANDEGVRYAHVDATSFDEAYAQARAQVGPGGVFEYNGQLYNTYTAEEWNAMSPEERADFQGRVGFAPQLTASHTQPAAEVEQPVAPEVTPTSTPGVSDSEIRVLAVEAVTTDDGDVMNVALIEVDGDQGLLIDVDNNGSIDVLVHDDNNDGQIQDNEIHDVSEAGIEVNDLLALEAAQGGDMFYVTNDDMPDYYNDADSIMSV